MSLPLFVLASFPASLPAHSELGAPAPAPGSATFGPLLRAGALRELAMAEDALSIAVADTDDGMTQARKAIRRVRALLDLAHEGLGRDGDALDDVLRRLAQALAERLHGRLLVDALDALRTDPRSAAATALLARTRHAAADARDAHRARHGHAPVDPLRRELAALATPLAALPWHSLDDAAALAALAKNVDRADAAGRRAIRGDKDPEWQHWRRRARRAWQQTHVLEALHPIDAAVIAGRDALARHLAAARDGVRVIGHCGEPSPFTDGDRRALLDVACAHVQHHRGAAIARFVGGAVD